MCLIELITIIIDTTGFWLSGTCVLYAPGMVYMFVLFKYTTAYYVMVPQVTQNDIG